MLTCTFDADGSTVLISGSYVVEGDVSARLMTTLPRLARVDLPHTSTLLALVVEELSSSSPGQQAALDRWLDLALVTALRAWFDGADTRPGWYAALADPIVGPALRAIHQEPARPWSLDQLARGSATSRTPFASRFAALVGEPPMSYVTSLRLDLAADLLRSSDEPLARIATHVGYATPFGLSAAFKRRTGLSPSEFRRQGLGRQRPAEA